MPIKPIYQRLWDQKKGKYPFHIEIPTVRNHSLVADELGFDDFISFASSAGGRIFGFKTEQDRDKFVATYGGTIVEL